MKKLKPSHREKKRYLLIKGKDANKEAIDNVLLDFLGILNYAEASPVFLIKNKNLVLTINRDFVDKIRASFLLSDKDLNVVKVSGSLKGLSK